MRYEIKYPMISKMLKYQNFIKIVGKYLAVSNICVNTHTHNSLLISNLQTLFAVCLRHKRLVFCQLAEGGRFFCGYNLNI